MALAKKGSRRITVDEVIHRWRVRGRPTCDQGMCWWPLTYAVEHAETPGTTRAVTTNQPHPGNWLDTPANPVLPSEVASTIRIVRAQGRRPEAPGSPLLLDRSDGFVPYG